MEPSGIGWRQVASGGTGWCRMVPGGATLLGWHHVVWAGAGWDRVVQSGGEAARGWCCQGRQHRRGGWHHREVAPPGGVATGGWPCLRLCHWGLTTPLVPTSRGSRFHGVPQPRSPQVAPPQTAPPLVAPHGWHHHHHHHNHHLMNFHHQEASFITPIGPFDFNIKIVYRHKNLFVLKNVKHFEKSPFC